MKIKGKQFRTSLKTKQLPEARRKLRAYRKDIEGLDLSAGVVTLSQLADRFEKTIQGQAPRTIANKVRVLNRVRTEWPNGSDRKIGSIKSSEISEFLTRYPGAAGYNQAREVILAMFRLAIDDRIISVSPAANTIWKRPKKLIGPTPSSENFRAIVESIRTQPWSDTREESADLVEFFGLAGMGNAEAAALTWSAVDFEKSKLTAFRQKTRKGFTVPIFPQLRPLLEKRWKAAVQKNGGTPPRHDTRVFSVTDPKKAISTACRRLNLPAYSARAFRRMFITNAIERGVDVKVIALWQGHQDGGKLILDTYSHVRPAHSDRMALLMK